jgi:hypothetical protein
MLGSAVLTGICEARVAETAAFPGAAIPKLSTIGQPHYPWTKAGSTNQAVRRSLKVIAQAIPDYGSRILISQSRRT